MTNEEAAAIAARAAAATPGPWIRRRPVGGDSDSEVTWTRRSITYSIALCRNVLEGKKEADADFIAHAREDIPALLAERETLMRIARVLAAEWPPFNDGAFQCCWCGLTYVMTPDDATHADDCLITLARAVLARAKGASQES